MVLRPITGVFFFGVVGFLLAQPPMTDGSKADADGPHVFHREGAIIVRSLQRTSTAPALSEQRYGRREEVWLTCRLPQSSDGFSFPLQPQLLPAPCTYAPAERIFVISDIEGNFEAFKRLLQAERVVDAQLRWTYGTGHLVLLGDFVDRGLNVTEVLWLIYKLEQEALQAGGRVHYILGNHEAMNLCGDHRYVRNKYAENAQLLGEQYPKWFDQDSELGRWLRTKNVVVRIGDYVFCHGGISPEVAAAGHALEALNEAGRRFLGVPFERISDPVATAVFDRERGLLWYRAAARGKLTPSELERVLDYAGARVMVVGHTLMPEVTALYGGRLLCADVLHEEGLRTGSLHTLLIDHGVPYRRYADGRRERLSSTPPLLQARSGQ